MTAPLHSSTQSGPERRAAVMEDQVPEAVVKDRFNRLLQVVQEISAQRCAIHEGTVQTVLAESVNDHDSSLITGRLGNNLLVHFPGDASMIGKFYRVHLRECRGFLLSGRDCIRGLSHNL